MVLLGSFFWRVWENKRYDPDLGVNLVVVGEKKAGVLVLRGGNNESSFVRLPEKLVVEAEGSGSSYRVGSLWGLGELERDPGKKVMDSLGNVLKLKFTGYVKVSEEDKVSLDGLTDELLRLFLRSNLGWGDRLRIRSEVIRKVADGELVEVRLSSSLWQTQADPDGVENYVLEAAKVKMWAARTWVNSLVLAERVNMAVFNNSDQAGKARRLAEILEVAGVKVVALDKGGEETSDCRYIVYRAETKVTQAFLRKILNCREGGVKSILDVGRVDIELFTGIN